MDQQQSDVRDPVVGTPGVDRVVDDAPSYATRTREWVPTAGTQVGENDLTVRNRVQWGPVIAGSVIAFGILVVMAVLGLAIGASASEPGTDLSDWGTTAGIYGGISVLVAMFVGGWVAAKSAAVGGPYAGLMNGLIAGTVVVLALIVASAIGAGSAAGFLGENLGDVSGFGNDLVDDAAAQEDAFNTLENSAWGTLAVIVIGLAAAAIGGLIGHNDRRDLIEGTG